MRRFVARDAFSLIELLVVVLILGILAALLIPRLIGERNTPEHGKSKAALNTALKAARFYQIERGSYNGLCVDVATSCASKTALSAIDPALGTVEPPDATAAGPSANPANIWMGNGTSGTDPTANTIVLCSASKGTKVFCVRDDTTGTYWSEQDGVTTLATVGNDPVLFGTTEGAGPPSDPAQDYATAVLADNPLVYYKFDETSGTTAADDSSNTYEATYTGTSPSAGMNQPGVAGSSRAVTTSSSTYLTAPQMTYATTNRTFEMWIKTTTADQYIYEAANGSGNRNCIARVTAGSLNQTQCYSSSDQILSVQQGVGNTVTNGDWHHLVTTVTYDAGANTSVLRSYRNGVQVGTQTYTHATLNMGLHTGLMRPLKIGRFATLSFYFLGSIDEFASYDHALNAARVCDHYKAMIPSGSC